MSNKEEKEDNRKQLELERKVQRLQRDIADLKNALNTLSAEHKYIVRVNKTLTAELIRLDHDVNRLKNDRSNTRR